MKTINQDIGLKLVPSIGHLSEGDERGVTIKGRSIGKKLGSQDHLTASGSKTQAPFNSPVKEQKTLFAD